MRTRWWRLSCCLAAATLVAASCTTERVSLVPPAAAPANPVVYFALGSTESAPLSQSAPAWPQIFLGRSLPHDAELTNVSVGGVAMNEVLNHQLPLVRDGRIDIATVWAVATDLYIGTPVDEYESALRDLVHQLSRGGKTVVLVANAPSVRGAPVELGIPDDVLQAKVDEFNAAIARVVASEHAVLVDIHAASLSGSNGDLFGLWSDFRGGGPAQVAAARLFGEAYASLPVKPGHRRSAGTSTTATSVAP